MKEKEDRIQELQKRVSILEKAIENYLQNPGCNQPSRAAAITALKNALYHNQIVRKDI